MSEHEYTPKSKAGKWFNDRLPLLTLELISQIIQRQKT